VTGWRAIDDARREAFEKLAAVSRQHGKSSRLYVSCRALWSTSQDRALWPLLRGDLDEAHAILERGIHAIERASTGSTVRGAAPWLRLALERLLSNLFCGALDGASGRDRLSPLQQSRDSCSWRSR